MALPCESTQPKILAATTPEHTHARRLARGVIGRNAQAGTTLNPLRRVFCQPTAKTRTHTSTSTKNTRQTGTQKQVYRPPKQKINKKRRYFFLSLFLSSLSLSLCDHRLNSHPNSPDPIKTPNVTANSKPKFNLNQPGPSPAFPPPVVDPAPPLPIILPHPNAPPVDPWAGGFSPSSSAVEWSPFWPPRGDARHDDDDTCPASPEAVLPPPTLLSSLPPNACTEDIAENPE